MLFGGHHQKHIKIGCFHLLFVLRPLEQMLNVSEVLEARSWLIAKRRQ